jgi:FtsH-binding integral membrane protein
MNYNMNNGNNNYQNPYNTNNYGGCNENWNNNQQQDIEMGGEKIDVETSMRLGFIRKVYGILSFQLLLTTAMCMLSIASKPFAEFQQKNPAIMWICIIGTIVVMIAISCFRSVARTVPTNYILLATFTFFEGYLVSFLCGKTNPKLVLMAAVMTCAITFALTYYACTTKKDFTVYNSLLFIAVIILMLLGLFVMLTQNKILHIIYCCIGVFIYSIYLIYDTQLLMGNKENALEIEDYILGALMLYVDIIQLFINLLSILKATE